MNKKCPREVEKHLKEDMKMFRKETKEDKSLMKKIKKGSPRGR